MRRGRRSSCGALIVIMVLTACSGDGDSTLPSETSSTSAEDGTSPEIVRPGGPTALIGPPLTDGRDLSLVTAQPGPDLAAVGYVQDEHTASGTATAYDAVGELPADGTYELRPAGTAEFVTRVIVRRPAAAADFNGTVVVEWLNVSSGADAAPDYTYLADEIVRGGYAWVGVSAQHIGIEGGRVAVAAPGAEITGAGHGLRAFDPARYGDLAHPGDAYSYDIYTQVGRALRAPGGPNPLGDLRVQQLLAVGESQSAYALTTYANGVQPLTKEFDGFLIHSRGGAAAPLGEADSGIDIAGILGGPPTRIRTDLAVPTMVVQTETDVLGLLRYLPARQPDSERFRLWEVAGTAHADAYQVGGAESILGCSQPINRGQQSFVLKSALRHLATWAAGGDAPPEAPRLDVDESGTEPVYLRDEVGNVTGGIRTPSVDAPVVVLSGLPVEGSTIICILMGSTIGISDEALAGRYRDRAAYLMAYERAADDAIAAGFVLDDDRDALMAEAAPERVGA